MADHPNPQTDLSCGAAPVGDIVRLLVDDGALSPAQVQHAQKVQAHLDTPRRLLDVVQELGYVTQARIRETLRRNRTSIRIGSLLVELGYISEKQLEVALAKQKIDPRRLKLGQMLVHNKYITEQELTQVLSLHLGFPYVEPDPSTLDLGLLTPKNLPLLAKNKILPLGREGDRVTVAMADPLDPGALAAARGMFGEIVPLITLERFIREILGTFHVPKKEGRPLLEADPNRAVALVDEILAQAVKKEASDVHFEPMKNRIRIRFRKDGSLIHFMDVPRELEAALTNRLKIMSAADITEKRRHQDGRILIDPTRFGREIDLRVSFYVSFYGETVVCRILTKKQELLKISDIGMPPKVVERYREDVLDVPTGVVIITGPTGSGKTTTLYASINYANRPDTKIITAEDPVEYVVDGITQCTINPKLGVTFEETLRHILRQDPDVIVLGEIRDKFSAESAIQAALTGHKVLTTFHTEDTIGGLLRLMNMDIETFLISSTVVSVVAQRLIKKVCPHCREPYAPSPRDIRRLRYRGQDIGNYGFVHGTGCDRCDFTGYQGRLGVFELLVLNEQVKEAILARKTSSEIRRVCIDTTGLITLAEDGLAKAARGITSLQEVIRTLPVLEPPRTIEQILRLSGETLG
jgi:type IV pilus assembly protein PilB